MPHDLQDYEFFQDPHQKGVAPPPPRKIRGEFNPVVALAILSLIGFIGIEILHLFLPADIYAQWLGDRQNYMLVIGPAILAVFVLTLVSFFKLLNARRKIEKERALMESVLQGSQGARYICDPEGQEIFSNAKFRDILGTDEPVSLTQLDEFFGTQDDQKGVLLDYAQRAKANEHQRVELSLTKKNKTRLYNIAVSAVGGWKNYIHFRLDDVTDKRTLEETLTQERQKLLDFMDNALVGFFSVNEKGEFLFANSTLARWFGVDDQNDFQHFHLHDFLAEPPEEGAAFDIFDKGGAKQYGEVVFKDKKGREFSAAIAHAVVYEDDGSVKTQSVIRDLTPEREMKEALIRSEDRFHRFFEDAPTGILLVSKDGKVEEANRSFVDIMGVKANTLVGKPLTDLVRADDQAGIKALIRSLDQKEKNIDPLEIQLSNTDETPLQVTANRLKGSQSFLFHFSDLSKQKQLEVQFTQSQKMQAVGQLAGGVAHDFNNLLTAIIGFCDLLLERHSAGDPSFHDIMQIKQNSNRAANLVRQLLAFSRQQTLRPQILDVTDVLSELSNLLRRLIGANITLNIQHSRDAINIKADHGQMEQVFINLVVNARDAMKDGGEITIKTGLTEIEEDQELVSDVIPKGQWIRVEVKDQGCGIPEENLSRILDPFFTTKAMGEGTGLGLSTVYGIIRQTGGYLDVESEVGVGTSFIIYLPLVSQTDIEEAKQVVEKQTTAKDLTGTERIMIVEDEEAVRKFSVRALSAKGYEVLEAEDGADALRVFDTLEGPNPVQLVISDVMMPEMDGPTMAKIVQEKYPDIKILFVSGFSEDRISDYAGDNIHFLPKPFSLKQLAEKVKEILDDA